MSDPSLLSLPEIETPRLRLRRCSLADAEPFQTLTNDPTIAGAVDFLTFPFERDDARRMILGNGDGRLFLGRLAPRETDRRRRHPPAGSGGDRDRLLACTGGARPRPRIRSRGGDRRMFAAGISQPTDFRRVPTGQYSILAAARTCRLS